MHASRHEVPDLPLVPEARVRVGCPAGSSPPVVRLSGGNDGSLPLCTARGRSRS